MSTAAVLDPPSTTFQTNRRWDPITFRLVDTPSRSSRRRTAEAAAWARPRAPLPNPTEWGRTIGCAIIECLQGTRPHTQLARWVDGRLYQAIARRAALSERLSAKRRTGRVHIRSASAYQVDEVTQEVSVTLLDGERVRALALRLELYHGRWVATALEIA